MTIPTSALPLCNNPFPVAFLSVLSNITGRQPHKIGSPQVPPSLPIFPGLQSLPVFLPPPKIIWPISHSPPYPYSSPHKERQQQPPPRSQPLFHSFSLKIQIPPNPSLFSRFQQPFPLRNLKRKKGHQNHSPLPDTFLTHPTPKYQEYQKYHNTKISLNSAPLNYLPFPFNFPPKVKPLSQPLPQQFPPNPPSLPIPSKE